MKSNNPRRIAYEMICDVADRGSYIDRIADKYLKGSTGQDRAFILRLVNITVERLLELDAVINLYAQTPVKKQKPAVRNVLRLGVCQIAYFDNVPEHAAVSESVDLIRSVGKGALSGFVNGVLRALCRDLKESSYEEVLKKASGGDLSVIYSMPRGITDMWLNRFGEEDTKRILKAFFMEKPLTLRVNTLRTDVKKLADKIKEALSAAGDAEDGPLDIKDNSPRIEVIEEPGIIIIHASINPGALPGYEEGEFYVQDRSAMLPVDKAMIQKGDNILDVCAAPGGKSIQAAILAGEDGHITACDLNASRAEIIRENTRRMGIDNIEVCVRDAGEDKPDWHGRYDVVLADLPCSGLGVLTGKPESKYRFDRESSEALSRLQHKILNCVYQYVKPGGRLVFSTCTINKRENEDNTQSFLESHGDFSLCEEMQLLPDGRGNDGFYYAVMKRA